MERLHSEASHVESQIKGFKSDLGRKTSSLHAVWEKFLQRVENRREVLTMATSFYGNISKVRVQSVYMWTSGLYSGTPLKRHP